MSESDLVLDAVPGVSRETSPRLDLLVALLRQWNDRINLVAPSTLTDVWRRHVLDSAQLWPHRPQHARRWADMGSGAGFPGLVIAAIAADAQPDLRVTLIESDARKCVFLAEASRAMGIGPEILSRRIVSLENPVYDVVSARALAPLKRLIPMAKRLIAPAGVHLYLKGAAAEDELTEAALAGHSVQTVPSLTDPSGVVVRLTEKPHC